MFKKKHAFFPPKKSHADFTNISFKCKSDMQLIVGMTPPRSLTFLKESKDFVSPPIQSNSLKDTFHDVPKYH